MDAAQQRLDDLWDLYARQSDDLVPTG
jgi:hypothetical protein